MGKKCSTANPYKCATSLLVSSTCNKTLCSREVELLTRNQTAGFPISFHVIKQTVKNKSQTLCACMYLCVCVCMSLTNGKVLNQIYTLQVFNFRLKPFLTIFLFPCFIFMHYLKELLPFISVCFWVSFFLPERTSALSCFFSNDIFTGNVHQLCNYFHLFCILFKVCHICSRLAVTLS